jgi:hypothetical protein
VGDDDRLVGPDVCPPVDLAVSVAGEADGEDQAVGFPARFAEGGDRGREGAACRDVLEDREADGEAVPGAARARSRSSSKCRTGRSR